jgi:hydrogenase maturation protease
MKTGRILVAGVGNVLNGDDGFGVRVIETLRSQGGLPSGVHLLDVGIGGIHLVQELMAGFDALIVVDTVERGGTPGTVYTLEPRVPLVADLSEAERSAFLADTHYAVPAKTLMLARALGVLPGIVYIIGCQPADLELGLSLSDAVRPATAEAARRVRFLVGRILDSEAAVASVAEPSARRR